MFGAQLSTPLLLPPDIILVNASYCILVSTFQCNFTIVIYKSHIT